jgi:DNA-binding NarL/FixJ family response regulator
MTAATVLLADDHPLFRRGLRVAVEQTGRYRVVAEAADGEAAIRLLARHAPALAVLDLAMPGKDGFEVLRWTVEHAPETRTVILTLYKDVAFLDRAVALGAAGYLVKDDAEAEIVRCLDRIGAGEFYASPNLARPSASPPIAAPADDPDLARLTPTQRAVLRLLANYHSSREIAASLGVALRTVENHRANMAMRLNLRGHNALLRFAVSRRGRI